MTAVRKTVTAPPAPSPATPPAGYRVGGDVGALQHEIERRLRVADADLADAAAPTRVEALVRACSVAGGYALLGGGYAAAAALLGSFWS